MIQIIPENRKQSTGSRFAEAFGNMLGSLGQQIPEELTRRESAEKLNKLTGQDISSLSPELQKTFLSEFMKQQGREKLQQNKFGFTNEILRGRQPSSQQGMQLRPRGILADEGMPSERTQSQGFNPAEISDEDILRLNAVDPSVGRAASHAKDVALREAREERSFQQKEQLEKKKDVRESYKENEKYINKVYDSYEDAERKSAIFDRMDQLEESGELSGSGVYNLLETMGLRPEWLKNPANEEYTKLGLDTLGGGTLQADYGSRVLASEFKVSLQRIPTLSQTPEGRKQIKENLKAMLLPSKLKKERMQYYLDKSERTGEPLPHNLRGKILRDIKPELDEAYESFKQRNGRYKVKEGTQPDPSSIEKYFYIANKDSKKAVKMMIEDGYDIKQ